jgi:hypothetical protein
MNYKILFLLLLNTTLAFTQNVSIKWGENQKPDNFISVILGEDKSGVYVLATKRDRYFLEKYDPANFIQVFSKELTMTDQNGKNADFENLFFLKGKFLLFSSFFDRKLDKYTVNASILSSDGSPQGEATKVFEIDAKKKSERGQFDIKISNDSSKILIYNKGTNNMKYVHFLRVGVIDLQLNLLAQFDETYPAELVLGYPELDPRISISDFLFTPSGKIFILVNKFHIRKEWSEFEFIGFDIASKNKVVYPLELKDEKISNLVFSQDENDILKLSGYYVERVATGLSKRYDAIIGVFFMRIDVFKKQVLSENKKDFDEKTVEGYVTKKKYDKGQRLPARFVPRKIVERKDGSKFLISEYFAIELERAMGEQGTTTYYYNDILVTSISADGKVNWSSIIPKKQQDEEKEKAINPLFSRSSGYSYVGKDLLATAIPNEGDNTIYYSFLLIEKDDKLLFVFNDHPDNIEQKDITKLSDLRKGKNGIPVIVTLDGNGISTKKIVEGAKDEGVIIRPRIALQTNSENIIIYGSRKSNDKLGRIIIK